MWQRPFQDGRELSLNRTSVGLKRAVGRSVCRISVSLNRTSVGLKPESDSYRTSRSQGLNRTSVGLKHLRQDSLLGGEGASIEPAWD